MNNRPKDPKTARNKNVLVIGGSGSGRGSVPEGLHRGMECVAVPSGAGADVWEYLNDPGWYMTMVQPWATILVLPAMISMLGSYMICREEQDDTLKSLLLIPLNETALTAAKMIVTFVLSVLIHLLLFVITLSTELILHYSNLSIGMVLSFFKSYLLEGVGVFLAVSPIIALVSYTKKSYWLALLLAEIYSFAGLFMSMSNLTRSFYPITGLLGVAGYYETTTANLIGSIITLLACGCLAVFILLLHRHGGKEERHPGK